MDPGLHGSGGGPIGGWPPLSRRLKLLVVAVTVLVLGGIVFFVIAHEDQQPQVRQLSQSMLVGPSSFPVVGQAQWTGPEVKDAVAAAASTQEMITPPECVAFLTGPRMTQQGRIALRSQGSTFGVMIGLPAAEADLRSLLNTCRTVQTSEDGQYSIEPRTIPGLPDWSTTVLQRHAGDWLLSAVGFHRGMFLSASRSQAHGEAAPQGFGLDRPIQQDDDALTKLFNDEVAQLDAA